MIIIDDFLTDTDLLTKINNSEEFWAPGYSWYDKDAPTSALRHELIHAVWDRFDKPEFVGYEHWTGVYSGGDRREVKDYDGNFYHLKRHFDKDEDLWHDTGEVVSPAVGTIFYPCQCNDDIEGGKLIIWNTKEEAIIDDYELIAPKFNRLVIFDASQLHGVQMVKKGTRKAIAINLWAKKPQTFQSESISQESKY